VEYEIELKLLTNNMAGKLIENSLLPLLDLKISRAELQLSNQYFDTPERLLRQHDIGLRIRGNNEQFEQTVKMAGQSMGGFHQRPEFNVSLYPNKGHNTLIPNLAFFEPSIWPKTLNLTLLQSELVVLFDTDFTRQIFLLEDGNDSVIELVWDCGHISAQGQNLPICEIELELKKGPPSALFDLAAMIAQLMPVTLGTQSKAARGYRLADNQKIPESVLFSKQTDHNKGLNESDLVSCCENGLDHFQHFSAKFQQQPSELYAKEIVQSLDALYQAFDGFVPETSVATIIKQSLNQLHKSWSEIMKNDELEKLGQDKSSQAVQWLSASQTSIVQFNIIQFLIEKPYLN
jgi:triphosphatase